MMVLFPPAALITVSQGAADGDLTYPIKRGLEDSILFLTSFNPTTRAYFAVARANRRYEETALLLSKGNNASSTIEELVAQSNTAAGDIGKISSASRRALLIADLSNSIARYDQGLAQANEKISQDTQIRNSGSVPSPQHSTGASASPFKPKPSLPGSENSPEPSSATQPTPQPSATAATSAPKLTGFVDEDARRQQEAIEKARRELEELRKRLEAEKKKLQSESLQQNNFKQSDGPANSPVPSPKPSPSPSLSPFPSPVSTPTPSPLISSGQNSQIGKKGKSELNSQSTSQHGSQESEDD